MEELEVECVHHNSGCQHTCQRQSLPVHLRDDCMFGQVECGEGDCDLIVVRADLKLHLQEKHNIYEKEGTGKQENGPKREDNDSTKLVRRFVLLSSRVEPFIILLCFRLNPQKRPLQDKPIISNSKKQ